MEWSPLSWVCTCKCRNLVWELVVWGIRMGVVNRTNPRKLFLRNACGSPIRKIFAPRKYSAIRYNIFVSVCVCVCVCTMYLCLPHSQSCCQSIPQSLSEVVPAQKDGGPTGRRYRPGCLQWCHRQQVRCQVRCLLSLH